MSSFGSFSSPYGGGPSQYVTSEKDDMSTSVRLDMHV
jgi:hypothetical protein